MAYLALIIVPILIAIGAVLSPSARQEIINVAHLGIERASGAVQQVRKNPNILKSADDLQRRIAAYLLRQAADNVEKK